MAASARPENWGEVRRPVAFCALRVNDVSMMPDPQDETKPHKLSVLLDAAESERFHNYCREKGFKKSTLIARLIREHLDHERYQLQGNLFSQGKSSS